MGRPHRGHLLRFVKIQCVLPAVQLVLLPNVRSDPILIQADRTHAVPLRPEVFPPHPSVLLVLPMDADGTLALQVPNGVRHAVPRRDRQTQVYVIRHRVPLDQLDPLLVAQVSQDPANLPPQLAV
jgi:hypothetical protein